MTGTTQADCNRRAAYAATMTPEQQCEAIAQMLEAIPAWEADGIRRTYEGTWTIVRLTCARLVVPTRDAENRIDHLWKVVRMHWEAAGV